MRTRPLPLVFGLLTVFVSIAFADEAVDKHSGEWVHLGGSANSEQFTPLTQINSSSIASLGLMHYTDLPVKEGLVGNALIKDGIAYESTPRGGAVAVNVSTGQVLWNFAPTFDYSNSSVLTMWMSEITRGLGLDEQNVYTADGCYLFAVNRATGTELWHTRICDPKSDLGTNSAPRTGAGKVFVGIQNLEHGTGRGYAAAFDVKTGKELWRFYTVPGDPSKPFENPQMELASKTWGPDYWTITKGAGGAASVWDGMIYDPKTNLLIFGTGNPAPHAANDFAWLGSHELLYSDSVIAVNASTGKYAWHYQTLSGDAWGISDATAHMILADLPLPGGVRHVLMSAEKQYFYVLDATTGQFISAAAYVPQLNFLMDPKTGKLTAREELKVWKHPGTKVVVQPGPWGGHTWILSSYNPHTGLVYIPAFIIPQEFSNAGESGYDYGLLPGAKVKAQGRLIAWDPIAQKERWHVDLPTVFNGGVLTTASDLVFQGTTDGKFYAYDAYTGKRLWSFDTNSIIEAGPSSVALNGKQVIVVPAGDASTNNAVRYFPEAATTPQTLMAPSRLLVFALGGREVLPATPLKVLPKPARERPSAARAATGERLFDRNQCSLCHGHGLQLAGQGRIPDLRTITEEKLDAMPAILQQGAFVPLGMPRYPNLTSSDITALQAYIENRAWEDYDQQEARARAN